MSKSFSVVLGLCVSLSLPVAVQAEKNPSSNRSKVAIPHVESPAVIEAPIAESAAAEAPASAAALPTRSHAGKNPWTVDPKGLDLASVNALVLDGRTNEVLYSRNADAVVSIASVSKLMTVMVVLDAKQSMDEIIPVAIHSTHELKNVFSRVRVNSQLSRRDMLLLTLMSSENRAAASLAHNYPGGYGKFIQAMNTKAKALGMNKTRFVEPTGLSYDNVSTARDLAKMVQAASGYKLIAELSTTAKTDARFSKPNHTLAFYNTNPLVRSGHWDIHLSKTGFNREAGQCLVMLTDIKNRPVTLVLLDSFGKRSHFGDANRVKRWLETGKGGAVPAAAKAYVQRKSQTAATLAKSS